MSPAQFFAEARALAQCWKKDSQRSMEYDGTFAEACAARNRCAGELLDLVFRLESQT
jgi:hypothetical protein